MRHCPAFLLVLLVRLSLSAQTAAPDLNKPDTLYAAALASNGLVGDDLKPWHLKANYELFDDEGKALSKGVLEEWWLAKNQWKITYNGNHFTGATYRGPEGFAHDGGRLSWPESLIAVSITEPILENSSQVSRISGPTLRKESTPPLSCLEVSGKVPPKYSAPLKSMFVHTYCFDTGTAQLRMTNFQFRTVFFNQFGTFQGRTVGVKSTIYVNGHALARINLDSLAVDSAITPATLLPPGSADLTPNSSTAITPPVLTYEKQLELPRERNKDIKSGVVVVGILVGKDGTVKDAHVLESPNNTLAETAVKAVNAYKFKAAQRDGQPVETEINVEVNIRLN